MLPIECAGVRLLFLRDDMSASNERNVEEHGQLRDGEGFLLEVHLKGAIRDIHHTVENSYNISGLWT